MPLDSTADQRIPLVSDDRPPTDQQIERLQKHAASLGYRIAVKCSVCGSWLVDSKSVAEATGPVCRGRSHA